ncbi:MAG: PstS family phosphate ABC transporter substrate-binding protein [Pseudoalteromonas sp.]
MFKQLILFIVLLCAPVINAQEKPTLETLLVAGSTSVTQMLGLVKEDFNQQSKTVMQLRGMGSDKGITAIAQNLVDIGASSRYMTKLEQEKWPHLKQFVLAQDALVFFANTDNEISNLSIDQLTAIYSGQINQWSQLASFEEKKSRKDNQIDLFSKGVQHGTFDVFLEFLSLDYMKSPQSDSIKLKKEGNRGLFSKNDVLLYNEFNQALGIVQRIPTAIAYDSFGAVSQFSELKRINKIRVLSIDGVQPSFETIKSGEYSFVRPLVIIINTQSDKSMKKGKQLLRFLEAETVKKKLSELHYVMVN